MVNDDGTLGYKLDGADTVPFFNLKGLKSVYNSNSVSGKNSVSTTITVPDGVKHALVVVSGYAYFTSNGKGSAPTLNIAGTGLKNSKLITNGGNVLETEVYACELIPGGAITATASCSYTINAVQIALLYP